MAEISERRDPPAHEIAEWWVRNQAQRVPGKIFVADLGEPSCFACGWYDQTRPTYPEVSIAAAWKSSRLQRAHLHPHSLGGSNHPSNYLMLRKRCHDDAPDWRDQDVMLTWAVTRESFLVRYQAEFAAAWKSLRPDQPFPAALIEDPAWQERVWTHLSANAGLHFGIGLKMSTLIAAIAAAADDISRNESHPSAAD